MASMVVLIDGRPRNAEYRRYKIKTVKGVDDFKSMEEVVEPPLPPPLGRKARAP